MITDIAKDKITSLVEYCYDSSFIRKNKLDKSQIISLSAAATVTYVVWRLYKRSSHKNQNTIDPSMLPPLITKGRVPIFGNLLALKKDPETYLKEAREEAGEVFRITVPGIGPLMVVNGKLISEVMKSNKNFSFSEGVENIVPVSKVVKLSYDHKYVVDEVGPREKNPITYPIKHNFKENQIDVFSERIQNALKSGLDAELNLKHRESRSVDTWQMLTHLISKISCPCFAGSKVGQNKELIHGMAVFTQKIIRASSFYSLVPEWLGNLLVRRVFSVEKEMDLVMNLITPELQKIQSGEAGENYEVSFSSMVMNIPKADGSRRTVEEAAYHFNSIALASIHTTSHFSAFALHELANSPKIVAALRAEIATLGNNVTPETVGELPLMDSFLREVLRTRTDFLGMHHMCIKDTVLSSGHFIPKGTMVVCALYQAHCDPSLMPVDEVTGETLGVRTPLSKFDAYRFVNDNIKSTAIGMEHLSFGLGPHACPGRYFAVNEIKYVLAKMITRYNIRTESGRPAKDNVLMGMTRFPPAEPLVFEGL